MHNTIALMILSSATNIAVAVLKWIRVQAVKLFQDCASVILELKSNQTTVSFLWKHSVTTH